MTTGVSNFILGLIAGGIIALIYGFLRGFSQHYGSKAANATMTWLLPDSDTEFSDAELQKRTLELHSEISEFQTRKERRQSRNFWDRAGEEMEKDEIMEKQKQQSVLREEMKGEFLKKFAPRLEMILQEYEKREIEIDDEIMDFESLRWWARHGETSRILPSLRHLAQKLEVENE